MRTLVGPAILTFAVLVSSAFPAFASGLVDFNEGLNQIGMKRYHAASECFQRAVQAEPGNQRYHFQLAECLQLLQEYGTAEDEYNCAYRINPFSSIGAGARAAVLEVEDKIARRDHPTDSVSNYNQAVREINRQAAEVQNRWIDWGNRGAAYKLRAGQIQANKLMSDAQVAVSNARHMRHHDSMIMSDAQAKANYIYYDSGVQANRYRQDGTHAAAETQISANTLKQLLAEPSKPGSPRLRALGTNLYVRNYNNFDEEPPPADPPLEMRATPLLLSDMQHGSVPATAARADASVK